MVPPTPAPPAARTRTRATAARVALALVATVLLAGACGSDDPATESAAATDVAAPPASGTGADRPEADGAEAATATSATSVATPAASIDPDRVIEYRVVEVARHPHDPRAYTQGLEVVDGLLLESTGVRGESTLRLVEPTTGEVIRSIDLAAELFAEGATVVDDEVWQLTWTSERLLIHGLDGLEPRREIGYLGEGWGLCATDDRLVMSNGSASLTLRDRTTFEIVETVEVTDESGPVAKLNELECVGELVWANIFQSTRLVAIDPTDGRVVGTTDVAELVPEGYEGDGTNVANGIAHDPATGRFWLTGKRWPTIYEVELVAVP